MFEIGLVCMNTTSYYPISFKCYLFLSRFSMARVLTEYDQAIIDLEDKNEKNKWNWGWLEHKHSVEVKRNGTATSIEFLLKDVFQKVAGAGICSCILCNKTVKYGGRGRVSLTDHMNTTVHRSKLEVKGQNHSISKWATSSAQDGFIMKAHDNLDTALQPTVSLMDRTSNIEAMILSFVAEHSLSLSLVPSLVELAKATAMDPKALSDLQLARTTASYKLVDGVARNITNDLLNDLKTYPFSINVDESTCNGNKKVLAVLVSYLRVQTSEIVLAHLASIEVLSVNSASIMNKLENLFTEYNLPWNNLVSCLFDSCNIMRGKHNGVEKRCRDLVPALLDIDGDSCHHIHNATKTFCLQMGKEVEQLFFDLHTDHKYASDQRDFLHEICDHLGIAFTVPARFVPHRWLSVYDICISTLRLYPAFLILYFGFMTTEDQTVYKDMLMALYEVHSIGPRAQKRISNIHKILSSKSSTNEGKERKKRLINHLWHREKNIKLHMHFYVGVLAQLKAYVCLFQSKSTLLHQLHDKQLQIFLDFLACFIKPQFIAEKSPRELKTLDLEDASFWLDDRNIWYGQGNTDFITNLQNDNVVKSFICLAKKAFMKSAQHMQKTLPLSSEVLQALSTMDPLIRSHSRGTRGLSVLCKLLKRFLPDDCDFQREISKYAVDQSLSEYDNNIVKWWTTVHTTGNYPGLCAVVFAALSCFHGPMVEGSFNVMGHVIDNQSTSMDISTYSAYQTIKYNLRSRNTTSVALYKRIHALHAPINKAMCRSIRNAASIHKQKTSNNLLLKRKRQVEFDFTPSLLSAKKSRDLVVQTEKLARQKRDKALDLLCKRRKLQNP